MADKQKDQRQQEPQQSVLGKALITGFVAGILWSGLGTIAYYFHFAEVSAASFFFRSFFKRTGRGHGSRKYLPSCLQASYPF